MGYEISNRVSIAENIELEKSRDKVLIDIKELESRKDPTLGKHIEKAYRLYKTAEERHIKDDRWKVFLADISWIAINNGYPDPGNTFYLK